MPEFKSLWNAFQVNYKYKVLFEGQQSVATKFIPEKSIVIHGAKRSIHDRKYDPSYTVYVYTEKDGIFERTKQWDFKSIVACKQFINALYEQYKSS